MERAKVLAWVLLSTAGGSAEAADVIVNSGQSIQAAIQAAAPGDRILVQPGTFLEAIDFLGKAIEVIGVGGPTSTILDATGSNASVVRFGSGETPLSVLRGFTVTGGTGSSGGSSFGGGGILVHGGADPRVENCLITGNSLSASGVGAGVFAGSILDSTTRLTLTDCVISANAGVGAFGNLTLRRCTIASNNGGGIEGPNLTLTDCLIANNTGAVEGGGLRYNGGMGLTLDRCTFVGNQAAQVGGGLFVNNPMSTKLEHCAFYGNSAGARGGGAYVNVLSFSPGVAEALIESSIFAGNQAGMSGGGLAVLVGSLFGSTIARVTHCTLTGNTPDGVAATALGLSVGDTIAWTQANPFQLSGGGVITVSDSDVQGGWPGTNNFSADPMFAAAASDDYHVTFGSPCVGAGNVASASDSEGDPQVALPDVGADEFHPHLAVLGVPNPGAILRVSLIGAPGSPGLLFASLALDPVGILTGFGTFGLGFPLVPGFPIGLGSVPATGVIGFPAVVPPTAPPGVSIHLQAFLDAPGSTLTNVESIRIH